MCRGFDTALRTIKTGLNVSTLPRSQLTPSPPCFETDNDNLDKRALYIPKTSPPAAALPRFPRTPSPTRSEANSDDLDKLALRTVSRRRAAARAEAHSPDLDDRALRYPNERPTVAALPRSPRTPSPTRSEADSDDLDELTLHTVTRRRVAAVQSLPTRRSGSDNDLDGLCRGLETALRFPHDDPRLYASFDMDKENHILPALKGAGQWLGLASLPFDRVRERAASKLLEFFDREVLAGQLVKNVPPRERVTLAWSGRLTKTAGVTRMKRLACGRRTAAIELSVKVVDEPARLYNTLAHELCHAAAWIIDECCKPPHGDQFKSWAQAFKLWDDRLVITTCHEYEIRYKFKYTCQGCGQVYGRHSRSINTSKKVCGKCRGALQLLKEL